MTYKEISEKHNIKISFLTRRVAVLKMKSVFVGRECDFTSHQESLLVNYNPRAHFERNSKEYHNRKLRIVEEYFKLKSGRKVSISLKIHRCIVDKSIREYNKTGFLIVESKLNKFEYFKLQD